MNWADFPNVQRFMTAAMQENRAPGDFQFTRELDEETQKLLPQAEEELADVLVAADTGVDVIYMLGYMSDAGYSVTRKDDEGTDVELKVYEILDMEY